MKIDLAGPRNRGLAMGLNEFAGYFAVGGAALATGWLAARYGLRPEPFYLGVGFVAVGLGLSALLVRETRAHVAQEARLHGVCRRRTCQRSGRCSGGRPCATATSRAPARPGSSTT